MRRMWSWLAVSSGKHANLIGVVGLMLTLILAMGIPKLQFATSTSSYLNPSDQAYIDVNQYQDLFGGEAMVTMVAMKDGQTVDHLFTPENRATMKALSDDLHANATANELRGVIGFDTALDLSASLVTNSYVDGKPAPTDNIAASIAGTALLRAIAADPTDAGKAARTEDTKTTLTRVAAVQGPHNLDNPEFVKFLLYDNQGDIRYALRTFFPDKTHAQIITRLEGQQALDAQSASATFVQDTAAKYTFDGATTVTTGAPALLKNINDYLKGGMFVLGGIAAAVMVVILLLLFDVRWRLLPLAVIAVGLTWAFGLAGYLGIPLTLATIAGLPVMLGVGIDYAIQMHARVEEEVIINKAEHPIQETARNLCPALLVVTFDAIFAFAALHFAKVPMIREFGLLLAVGIAVICLCSIVMPLAALGAREYRSPTTRTMSRRSKILGNIVVKLGNLPAKSAIPLALASLVIFLGGIAVEPKLTLQTDPVQWVDQNSQVIKDIHAVQEGTGSANELGVFVEAPNVFDDKVVAFTDNFTVEQLKTNGDKLATATGAVSTVSDLINGIPGAGHVAPTGQEVAATYAVAPPDVRSSLVANNGKVLNIVFRTGTADRQTLPLKDTAVVVDDMKTQLAVNPPPDSRATPSGLAVVGVGLLENLEGNRVLLTYLAIAFVGIFLTIRMRSLIRSLLSLVPVLIAVGAASLVAYAFHLKLSPLTAVGGPLVVAVCTEFTSLILLRFIEERGRGYSPKEAIDVTAERTGRAFIVSGLTAISGVVVISLSSMPLLRDFGIVVGMNVAVALLSALVFLPPMLVWADADGRNWVSRNMTHDTHETGVRSRDAADVTVVVGDAPATADAPPAAAGGAGTGKGASGSAGDAPDSAAPPRPLFS